MSEHLKFTNNATAAPNVDCSVDPVASLVEMFVGMVQAGRIAKGQCPAMRPVFLKPHGVAHGLFRIRPDLPNELRVGLFSGTEFPVWIRFSSDTLPIIGDYKTTIGLGIKLFNTPTPKIFGAPEDTTFDFILQNFDIFFVDTAADMCAFTRAGVVNGDYGPYLAEHPETARILDEMAKPVASTLASSYWSCVPFCFGRNQHVKYKLEPVSDADPLSGIPQDPSYLAADLGKRLKGGEARFRFSIQFSTDPVAMPLDKATVRWEESVSPPIHLADLILPQQDINARGQAAYGENLSFNIWRVTEEHKPVGSIAEARRAVYSASAQQRRDVNGVPTGEPNQPRPASNPPPCVDSVIVRAAIHPAIGIARLGDSSSGFYIGPEVLEPAQEPPNFYRDDRGALKRQAARFRLFGYNAAGQLVREILPDNADIEWTVHLANKKAQWYQFQAALDIPDSASLSLPRRNADVPLPERQHLIIDPGPRRIQGKSASGGTQHLFDSGKFKDTIVSLGEIRTDENGRLLVLGGTGQSASPSNAPIFNSSDANSFNNANDWYDDISDGPVTAVVSISGKAITVEPAWVVVAPPNYAPNIIGWRTLYDLLVDVYIECGWMEIPKKISFTHDVLPFFKRLSNLQWVNKGFAAYFGKGGPLDFSDTELIAKLAHSPNPVEKLDPHFELRQVIFNAFRPNDTSVNEPRTWPWIYGDAFGSFGASSPNNNLKLSSAQQVILKRWAHGDFVNDWNPSSVVVSEIDKVPLTEQPGTLDKASLSFCLADAFHPGCEMTWPIRHASLYEKPFRIRHRASGEPDPDYGANLTQQIALQPDGPLHAQSPGDISRWMAIPWQGDTAFCRSGYEAEYNPYLPTFWPARVPNQVLTEEDYEIVMNTSLPREERVVAFNNRPHWIRTLKGSAPQVMLQMVAHFGALGVVVALPGLKDDPDFPEVIFVESLAGSHLKTMAVEAARMSAEPSKPATPVERAGWENREQMEEFRRMRIRQL